MQHEYEMIVKSFNVVGIALGLDGSENHLFQDATWVQDQETSCVSDTECVEPEDNPFIGCDSDSDYC